MRFKKYSQQGLSLLELLISISIGMLIIGMMGNAYISSNRTTRNLNQASIMTENGRFATTVLKDEVQVAGAFGFLDNQLGAVSTNPNLPDPCTINVTTLTDGLSVPITGYDNVGAGGAAATVIDGCLPAGETIKAGTDILVTRRGHSNTVSLGALDPDSFYIQSTSTEFVLEDGNDPLLFDLTALDGATFMQPRLFVQTIFYVSGQDDQLKKLTLNQDAYTVTAIADNVEDFQVEYGIDRSGNGAANASAAGEAYIPAIADGAVNGITDIWQNIVSVRAALLLRAETADPTVTDTRTYDLDLGEDEQTVGPFNDNFRRRLFYFSTRANNLSMRREG